MARKDKKNKKDQQKNEAEKGKSEKTYTGGFVILLFIFLMTVFLILTQPVYYHKTIIFFSFGAAFLILFVILFSILQKPLVPPSESDLTGKNLSVEVGDDNQDNAMNNEENYSE